MYYCKDCGVQLPLTATIYPFDVLCVKCLEKHGYIYTCENNQTCIVSDIEKMWRYAVGMNRSCSCIKCDKDNNYLCQAYECG